MKYVYPAIFIPTENGVYSVHIPDLPGCRTFGNSLAEALEMAEDALAMWLADAEKEKESIPAPSPFLVAAESQLVSLVKADTDAWRRKYDTRSVKKTLSIPNWLNTKAEAANAPYSQILQEGLKNYLGIE